MTWTIEYAKIARKPLRKLDVQARKKIREYLENCVLNRADPRSLGRELKGNLSGLWRYRVEDYRIICKLEDEKMVVLVVRVGHRKDIYG